PPVRCARRIAGRQAGTADHREPHPHPPRQARTNRTENPPMPAPLRLLILACALAVAACAAIPALSPGATFVVVRHAEKVDDGSRDPSLTDAGSARADALARMLRSRDVVAVYATDFRRTRNTAQPTAAVHDLSIISYDSQAPADALAARLRRAH